jgi:membrane protein YqaA with SNARE-associated domain
MTDHPLWELFISALISSTLLPGGSEALLIYHAVQQIEPPILLLIVATTGNSLGGMLSWGMGRWLVWRFPARQLEQKHQTAIERFQHWGSPALLFSWLPIIGDPLCLAAGWLKTHWLPALLFIVIGKALRYYILIRFTT